jgi:peptide deformylase
MSSILPSNKLTQEGLPNLGLTLYPDPALLRPTTVITEFGSQWLPIAESMSKLMITINGSGLAAQQAGLKHRILVYKVDSNEGYMLNPVILNSSDTLVTDEEGCLSFPGVKIGLNRPSEVTVQYQDYEGTTHTLFANGMLAKVLQHEIDHLDGILFTKHLSSLKKDIIHRKMNKFKKEVIQRREKLDQLVKQLTKQQVTAPVEYDFSKLEINQL